MADVIFDCTQFLSFDLDVEADVDVSSLIVSLFEKSNLFRVLSKSVISEHKLSHLAQFINTDTVEIQNQEFIGEFDEWFEMDEIPYPIQQFGQSIQELYKNKYIKKLTIILVRYAYSEKNTDTVFIEDYQCENIYEGLYHASCFGNSGNIVVLRLSKT
ncbi:hypothetical protein [Paenibacillus sp. P46E]|uniref:hypothetical protein n=1 Tax=Paenibacillus sp. P46E TaxID=1349436 RepID=UPI00093E8969|nr:hypothetical protein [Paenibacillus sp. P46E]OKQ00004.1 hypothetical protein A3849_02095 [Paenibacillus sp. P46E]